MLFVDGENFTVRAQKVAESRDITIRAGEYFQRDVFVWFPDTAATESLTNTEGAPLKVQSHAIRAHYYTSACGDEVTLNAIRTALHDIGFQPSVFKKEKKSQKSKGVDISLATDLLSNAFQDNFDVAVLVAGDGDYVPLVQSVKRLGKVVYVIFFEGNGTSPALELASDRFFDCTSTFCESWQESIA